jgi:tetratricopeptide (TPR) repeat protein
MPRFYSLVLLLYLGISYARAQEGGDLQAQIEYAFQVEDRNQLTAILQTLGTQVKAGPADAALRYHLAHARYRYGLLERDKHARDTEASFSDCIDELKPNLDQEGGSVESLVLQSACYSNLARLKHLEAVVLRSRAQDRLNAALKRDPRNPRAVLFSALDGLERSKPGSPDHERAFQQLQSAAQLFDESSATRIDVPGWGHAEAYLALGIQLQSRGDLLAARNWIEKSLIVAPDYKTAQRQLAALVRR